MLQLSYDLLEHPIFKNKEDHEDHFTSILRDSPEYYRHYNRTIIERTISQSQTYENVKFDFGILTMTSQGIENVLNVLKTLMIAANALMAATPEELRRIGAGLRYFQLTEEGHVHAAIKYFLHACQVQILNIRTMMWKLEFQLIKKTKAKNEFLQRRKADLLHLADSTDELIFKGLMEWLTIEIDLLNAIKEPELGLKTVNINSHEFLASFSFPGEARDVVKEVADELERLLGSHTYFYDNNYRSQLARPSLDTLLQDIYRNRSQLVVVFLSGDYQRKKWCGVEFRAIREMIMDMEHEKIIYVRIDDGNVDGVFNTDGYLDGTVLSPAEIAQCIAERVELLS